ncbi:MAG: POTRA domain-containing protein [Bdellovibrionales bacterium]
MRALLLGFIFLSSMSFASWDLDLSKLSPELQENVKQSLGPSGLKNLTLAEVDDIIKLIHLQAQFDPVAAVTVDERTLQILIQTRPRISSVKIVGMDSLGSESKKLISVNPGDTFDLSFLIQQSEQLQENLRALGYTESLVEVEYPENQPGKIDVTFNMKLGSALKIQDLEIRGKNPELLQKLKRFSQSFKKEILTDLKLKEIFAQLENLLKKERAYQTKILPPEIVLNANRDQARIKISLENDAQYSFELSGSTQLSSLTGLDEVLTLEDINLGNSNLISDLTNRIRQYYLTKGYARVEILPVQKSQSNYKINIDFQVKEGPVVKVEKITFQGRLSRSSKYYSRLMLNSSPESLQNFFYLKEDLDKAVEALKLTLQNQGYLQVQINSTRAIYNTQRDRISITVNMDEGPLTLIDQLSFENAQSFTEDFLRNLINLQMGEPLQLQKIEEAIATLKKFYKDNGFLEMMLLNERQGLVVYNEDNSKARLNFKIFEGPQVRVQSIVIEGLKKTKPYVVLYELDFKEGDLLTPRKIEESVSRIQRTAHFSSVDIRTLEDKTEVKDRTVLIRVTESNPGKEVIGIGITNERDLTVRGYVGWSYRNLWGTGRGISTRWDANYNIRDIEYLENRFTVGYLEPFIFNTQYKGRINLTRTNSIIDYEQQRATVTVQGTASVEKDFTSNITGVWDVYSRASSEDFNIDSPRNKDALEIASTGLTLDFDFRDSLVRPRKGHQSRLNLEYGSPAFGSTKTIEFVRGAASATVYTSFLSNKITWANGVRYGFLENTSSRTDGGVPYRKKGFFLGGPSTIRGFDPTTEAFPDGELLDNQLQDRMTGKTKMYLVRSTLSYPISGIFEGTLFYDGGEVEVEGLNLGFGYRHAAGLGLVVNTPVGPLNLELGFKLNQKPGESPNAFHLSFGLF